MRCRNRIRLIEPDGEEVYYGHRESKNGGRLHDDITTGFGPETYTLPRMQPGEYRIVLDYYADDITTVSKATLAHIIVRVKGERRDFFIALTNRDQKRVVATISR